VCSRGSEDGRGSIGGRGVRDGVGRLLDELLTEGDAPPKVNGHAVEELIETV
jgi:hypothetical protein